MPDPRAAITPPARIEVVEEGCAETEMLTLGHMRIVEEEIPRGEMLWLSEENEEHIGTELTEQFAKLSQNAEGTDVVRPSPWSWMNGAMFLHAFAYGCVLSVVDGIMHGSLRGVMALSDIDYATARTTVLLPLSLKVLSSVVSDSFPLAGYRRKTHAGVGWFVAALVLVLGALLYEEPEPRLCFEGGVYTQTVCNPSAGDSATGLVAILALTVFAATYADAAAQGLLIEVCKAMDAENPGHIQVAMMLTRGLGGICGCIAWALFFNGPLHLGRNENTELALKSVLGYLSCLCSLACILWPWLASTDSSQSERIPCCGCGEDNALPTRMTGLNETFRTLWRMFMCTPLALFVAYNLVTHTLTAMQTPADALVWRHWVHIENLEAQIAQLIPYSVSILVLLLVQRYMLNIGWRTVVILSVMASLQSNVAICLLTALGAVRNKYLFLTQDLLLAVPVVVNTVIVQLACPPISATGQEATFIGLVESIQAAALPLGQGIAAPLYGALPVMWTQNTGARNALSDPGNFVLDSDSFRVQVALSYCVRYALFTSTLFFVPWLPTNRLEAHKFGSVPVRDRRFYTAVVSSAVLASALAASVAMSVVTPSCQEVRGPGCT